jgi:hypothetical protein
MRQLMLLPCALLLLAVACRKSEPEPVVEEPSTPGHSSYLPLTKGTWWKSATPARTIRPIIISPSASCPTIPAGIFYRAIIWSDAVVSTAVTVQIGYQPSLFAGKAPRRPTARSRRRLRPTARRRPIRNRLRFGDRYKGNRRSIGRKWRRRRGAAGRGRPNVSFWEVSYETLFFTRIIVLLWFYAVRTRRFALLLLDDPHLHPPVLLLLLLAGLGIGVEHFRIAVTLVVQAAG